MKFVCPRCRAGLSIPEERVPAAGAWARCPKCQERFFLKVRGALDPLAAETGPAGRLRPGGRTAGEQRLLDRQRARMGRAETSLEGPDGLGEVTVFPAPAPNYGLYGLAAALAVGGFLGFLAHAFRSAGDWTERPEPTAPPTASYEERGLAADLAAMRRDFRRRPGLRRNIGYSGREARVFKYLMAQLAPEACGGEFFSLRLWSPDTRQGFKAIGACLNEGQTAPELEVKWMGEAVQAGLAGRGRLEISLSQGSAPDHQGSALDHNVNHLPANVNQSQGLALDHNVNDLPATAGAGEAP